MISTDEKQFTWVPGYEGLYDVSEDSTIRSHRDGIIRILKPNREVYEGRYINIALWKDEKKQRMRLHVIVAITFHGFKPGGRMKVVDHKNKNKSFHHKDNIRVISNRKNVSRSIDKSKTSSRFIGVSFNKRRQRWNARIRIMTDGKSKLKNLGLYDTEIKAYLTYKKALKRIEPC